MRRGHRTFPPEYYEDGQTIFALQMHLLTYLLTCFDLQDSLTSYAQTFVEKLSQITEQLVRLLDNMLVIDDIILPG